MVITGAKGRPPTATAESGAVSWDNASNCFIGENGYYWHGSKAGGWLTEKPTKKQKMASEPDTPNTPRKGRKPKPPKNGVRVEYDFDEECYKTDGGLYWHGSTALGKRGWTDYPPSEADQHEMPVPDSTVKPRRKGRPPTCDPSFGTDVHYDLEEEVWKTDKGYSWTGSIQLGGQGWQKDGQ
mmetsp:Transcript_10172/g.12574  ORF Transcript_10172/g.12574 Transcript_10172/m.12574 type:complete len:182 (-) Transcript_10172:384-929(-)